MKRNHTFYPASRLWARGENWEIFFGSKMYNLRKISLRFPMTSRSENYTRKFFTIYFFAVVCSGFSVHTLHTQSMRRNKQKIFQTSLESHENILKRFYFIKYTFGGRRKKKARSVFESVCATSTRKNSLTLSQVYPSLETSLTILMTSLSFRSQNSRSRTLSRV